MTRIFELLERSLNAVAKLVGSEPHVNLTGILHAPFRSGMSYFETCYETKRKSRARMASPTSDACHVSPQPTLAASGLVSFSIVWLPYRAVLQCSGAFFPLPYWADSD